VLAAKAEAFQRIVKIGRTHLMDAVPLTLGQEFSAYARQIENGIARIEQAMPGLLELPIGGTAVGTGLNTPKDYDVTIVRHINAQTECEYNASPCKFEGLAAHDACVMMSGALKTLSCSMMKIANDLRWMASGPRCGLGELSLPDNEPGSSIMPGKVNPTQCEMVTMVCCQVVGNDTTITMAGASGNFELNVYKPVIALNLLQSIRLLAGAAESFTVHCVEGAEPVESRIEELLDRSLMLVTALNKHIGYDAAAKIAQTAHRNGTTLMQEAVATGLVTEEDFKRIVDPQKMV
jgi:fumarate hydratase class II